MKNPKGHTEKPTLRRRAEAVLGARTFPDDGETQKDPRQLIEELRTHRIELEMQNQELRGSQLALETSRAEYGDLYDFAPVGYFVSNANGFIEKTNLMGASMVGVPRASLVGTPITRLVYREDQDIFYVHRKRILETKAPQVFELRLVKRDNSFFYARLDIRPHRETDRLLVAVTDISSLKEAQRELRESHDALERRIARRTAQLEDVNKHLLGAMEEKTRAADALLVSETRYRSLVESTDDFIYLVNENGRYLFMNNRTRSLYGLSPDGVEGRYYGEFHDEADTRIFMDRVRQVFKIKGTLHQERRHNGRYYLRTLSPVKGPDGSVRSVSVVSKEITDQKKMGISLMETNETLRREQARRIALSGKLMDLLEEDRRRIAGDLHDQVGQMLTSLKMDLENLHPEILHLNSDLSKQLAGAVRKTTHIIRDIKTISNQLRPGILNAFGLEQSLAQRLREVERKGLKTGFFCRDIPKRFRPEKELALYRIAQEAIHNVMKHAHALTVHVNLTKKDGNICLGVEDDGIGFDAEKTGEFDGGKGPLGLTIMRERAFQMGGELTIESAEGSGTLILAEIPL